MKLFLASIRYRLHVLKARRRFPHSVIHNGVYVDAASQLNRFSVLFQNVRLVTSSVSAYSYIQENTSVYNSEIGAFCSIAANVTIGLANHPIDLVSSSPVFYDSTQPLPRFFVNGKTHEATLGRTIIGADVWIGEGAKIVAGVKIGTGAVVGAGAIVTRDIPPYAVAAGVPCRSFRSRFETSTCERLLASRWWELDDARLAQLAHHFDDPLALLKALEA